MRYFDFLHLREPLRGVSAEFAQLAHYVALELPAGPEQSVALRKLLEAKDAAVRAALDLPRPAAGEQVLGVLRETRVGEVCCGAGPVAAAGEPVFREGAGGGCCRSEQPAEGAGEEGADRG